MRNIRLARIGLDQASLRFGTMPRKTMLGCLLALNSLILTVPIAAAQETTATFALMISSKTPEVHIGSKVWITIIETNLTDDAIDCTVISRNGVDIAYHFEVTDEDGNPAERAVRPHMDTEPQDIHPCNLVARSSLTTDEQISRLYRFDRTGKYSIRMFRFDPGVKDLNGKPLKVWSNSITITITG